MSKILMFLMFSFLLNIFIHSARAEQISKVPVVSIDQFVLNKTWTWSYYTKTNQYYSTERYKVLGIKGTTVALEMASTYKQGEPVRAHHLLAVDVSQCLAAYAKPGVKKTWKFRMYYWNGKAWDSAGDTIPNAAFEEKFNCNPHVTNTAAFETVFDVVSPSVSANGEIIFQQRKNKKQDGSWYFYDGVNAGTVAQRFADAHDADYGYMLVFQGVGESVEATPMLGKF